MVTVREDPDLVRRGTELYVEVPVTFAQAALGASVSVRTVEGSENLAIPAGTQSGQEIRLRGQGSRACAVPVEATSTSLRRWWFPPSSPSASASCCASWAT